MIRILELLTIFATIQIFFSDLGFELTDKYKKYVTNPIIGMILMFAIIYVETGNNIEITLLIFSCFFGLMYLAEQN
jgi:hypothetical protein